MKRVLLIALLLLPQGAFAQSWSTGQIQEYQRALSNRSKFGVPRYATTSLPTCAAGSNTGALAYDTTANSLKVCVAAGTWDAAGGGGIAPGTTTVTGGTNGGVFFEASDLVQTDADFTYISDVLLLGAAAAGTNALEWQKTMAGGATDDNFLRVTGTTPATLTAATNAINYQITGAGSSAQTLTALNLDLLAGYTGASATSGARFTNASAGTNIDDFVASAVVGGNAAVFGSTAANSTGRSHGGVFRASNSNGSGGSIGVAGVTTNAGATGVGVAGYHSGAVNGSAGFFFLGTTAQSTNFTTSALVADNGAIAANIFTARDNGTPVFTIEDGGGIDTSLTDMLFSVNNNLVFRTKSNMAVGIGTWFGDSTPYLVTAPNLLNLGVSTILAWHSGADPNNASGDTVLSRGGVATLQLGALNAASPIAQILRAQGSRAGTDSNVAGANLTILSSLGTGNAAGSSLILQAPLAVGSGTGVQTATTLLTLNTGTGATFAGAGGRVIIAGTAPTITSCGTTPSTITGSSGAGYFTWGTGDTDASCTITFPTAFAVKPSCSANNETTIVVLQTIPTTTTLEIVAAVAATVGGDVVSYKCVAGS